MRANRNARKPKNARNIALNIQIVFYSGNNSADQSELISNFDQSENTRNVNIHHEEYSQ